jgi:hypothetical protein
MAFATARLIALRSALLIIFFVASDPTPISTPTRNVGRLATGARKNARGEGYRTAATAKLSRRCAQMRGEESLPHSGTPRCDDDVG